MHPLQLPILLAFLAQEDLVFIHMEQDVLRGSILPCLLLWNRILLAVAALDRLALPVGHNMLTPLQAGALRDGKQQLLVPCNGAPSPHLLLGLHLPGAMLRISCKLVVHDTTFCLQQTMKGVQANTLCAAVHLHVGVSEAAHASESADNAAERVLTNLPHDG